MALFDISKFLNHHGFAPTLVNRVKADVLPTANDKLNNLAGAEPPLNPLGSPVVFNLTLGNYKFEIPPVITVSLKKNIVTTKITGADLPPVIESIGVDSYEVKIQGYIENTKTHTITSKAFAIKDVKSTLNLIESKGEVRIKDNQFPGEKLRELVNLFKVNESLEASSDYLELFGISRIVLTDMPEITHYPTSFSYSFSAISDKPFELEILD